MSVTAGGEGEDEEGVVVCLGGMFGDAYHVRSTAGGSTDGACITASVTKLPKRSDDSNGNGDDDGKEEKKEEEVEEDDGESRLVELSAFEYKLSSELAHLKIAGESRALQVRVVVV